MDDEKKILLTRSEELSDIMEQIPHWLIRSGVLMLMLVLMLIFGGSYFLPHSEKIILPVKLMPIDHPVPLVLRAGGFIDTMCVEEGDIVETGDYILYLRGTENIDEILVFEKLIDSLREVTGSRLPRVPEMRIRLSGQYNLDYSELLSELRSLSLLSVNSLHTERIGLLNERISKTKELLEDTRKQYSLRVEEMALISDKTARDSTLYSWKMSSLDELEVSRRQYLNAKSAFYDYNDRLRSLELLLLQLGQEKREIEIMASDELVASKIRLGGMLDKIKTRLETWKSDNLLASPVCGRVYFNEDLSRHMRLESGTVIGLVVPPEVSAIKCIATARGEEAVLIREGMNVRLRLPGYESDSGNYIEGIVSSVGNVGINGLFRVAIDLKDDIANLNERFGVFYGLEGTAEVIVKRGRLFHKLLEPEGKN
jgi:uncharacterized small protein (DUF1192 family)